MARPCAPGLLALPRARGPFPRATELLGDVGGYCWQQVEEGGACGSDPSGGKPDRTKKGKRKTEISTVSKPSFPSVAIENVK